MANTEEITPQKRAAAQSVLAAGFTLDELRAAYNQIVSERLAAMISTRRERYADALIDYFDILGVFSKEDQQRDKKKRIEDLVNILKAQEGDFLDQGIPKKDKFDDILAEWLGE